MDNKFLGAILGTIISFSASAEVNNSLNLQFENVTVSEFAKVVYSDVLGEGFLISDGVGDSKFSLDARNVKKSNVEALVKKILAENNLSVSKFAGVHHIKKIKVGESSLLSYTPKFRNVSYISELVVSAFPNVSLSGQSLVPSTGQTEQPPIQGMSVSHGVSDRQNSDLVVLHAPSDKHAKILDFIETIDVESAQVLFKAVAYEVSRDTGSGSAIDVALSLLQGKVEFKTNAGFQGNTSLALKFPDITALINILDGDSRFKSLTRPNVRVKSGSTARFNVGSEVPILAGVVTNNNGNSNVQSVEYRNSGVSLDVSPVVKSQTIDVKLKQEISNFVQTTTGVNNSPTLNKRFIETDLSLSSGEVILIGGLESVDDSESQKNLPFLKLPFAKSSFKRNTEILLMIEVIKI